MGVSIFLKFFGGDGGLFEKGPVYYYLDSKP